MFTRRAGRATARQPSRSRGAVQVEFALTLMITLFTIFWMWEMAMAVYTYTVLADAANEGVRYAIVHSGDQTGTVSKVNDYARLSLHDTSGITVAVGYPDGGTTSAPPPSRVTVTVTYTYIPYVNFMPNTLVLRTYAEGRIVY
jgi:Flp pilus assembly protein TadG